MQLPSWPELGRQKDMQRLLHTCIFFFSKLNFHFTAAAFCSNSWSSFTALDNMQRAESLPMETG